MTMLFPDTSPAAQRVLVERLRGLPAWRKLRMVSDMNAAVRGLVQAGLRQRYPAAGPDELRRRCAELLLGADLAGRAYGPLDGEAEPGAS